MFDEIYGSMDTKYVTCITHSRDVDLEAGVCTSISKETG